MDPFRIVHISDLHFGMDYQDDIWKSLIEHLLRDPRPDAIIATGDLADTPDPGLFDEVAAQFDRLTEARIPWTVCAGNHDRHSQGNAGWLGRVMGWFKDSNMDPASFDRKFKGHIADLQSPQEWTFPDVPRGTATPVPKWRVRVLGIDSSKAAQYSAQGFVKLDVLGAVNGATRSQGEETTRDLVIALVHHHLLPIAALEQSSQHVSSVLNTTTLVNAGSVLENCATNNVNLVLHGHEHMRNIARYGVPGKTLASDLVVLGAGSATGADTWAGCDATRASINVLELRRDRSVYVQEQRIVGGQWQDCGDAVCLLDGRQIREARVLRRDDLKARPVSRIERHFAFTEYRDIDVRETRTFWPVTKDHQLVFDVHRLSGSPILGKLNVDWEGGGTDRWAGNPEGGEKAANFGRPPDGGRGYRLQLRIDDWRTKAQRLELEYTWSRSAILTMTDLQLLRDDQLDDFRRAGKEAVSIHVTDPLDSLTLSISLPPALLPQGGRIEVHVGHLENAIEKIEPHQELQEFLHVMPGGYATLTVPFPLPECRYFLAWRPHAAFAPDASVTATRDRIGGNGDHIASKTVADLMPRLARRCTVALYVPELIEAGGVQFRLRGFAGDVDTAAAGEARPPEVYRARDEYDSVLGAWYGEPSWSSVDPANPDDRDGMRDGEEDVFVLPAYQFRWSPASEPWGIFRIGLGHGEPIDEELAERIAMAAAIVL
jgi:hypothetical protein